MQLFLKAKAILVSSKLNGETVAVTNKLKQYPCLGKASEGSKQPNYVVTCCELYDYKNEEYIALGLKDGSVVIKLSENLLNNLIVDHIKPGVE